MRVLLCAAVIVALTGCGGSTDAPVEEPSSDETPAPACPVAGVTQDPHGAPLAGVAVVGKASEQIEERRWREVTRVETTTASDGTFAVELPCGARVGLEFEGWTWPNQPAVMLAEPAGGTVAVLLIPVRTVDLRVRDGEGNPLVAELDRGLDSGPSRVPAAGLLLEGVPYGGVTGVLSAEGKPSRAWRVGRSDTLSEPEANHFEAEMILGESAPLWVHVVGTGSGELTGVWCIEEASRGNTCKLQRGAWKCECGVSDVVGISAKRWDVGVVRTVSDSDLDLAELPGVVHQCLTVPGGGQLRVHPDGAVDTLLLGTTGPAAKLCLDLPKGQPLIVERQANPPARFVHVPEDDGDVTFAL